MHTDPELGTSLLALARGAIAAEFGIAVPASPLQPRLSMRGATFVTLRRDGELRGCIGSVEAHRPLRVDVHANAVAAAFHDPRFTALSAAEFTAVSIEVSLLGPTAAMSAMDEAQTLAQLRPHVDGVVLTCGRNRATFLPQVWEQLPDPREFLAALKHKAGLPADYWSARLVLSRYAVAKFAEVATEGTPA
ncbi:MAG: AmmeMemoRadiSam system protein A [Burkholderiales bacterium]|nr:AmmeMemoRadiSam system protein A [Burkholderiales bacterium]